ncbi:MAG: hypothetical protein ACXVRE_05885 [Gaiellaceae bacterium]
MIEALRQWREKRRAARAEKAVTDAEGAREGLEVWETKRLGRQWGAQGSGRRTSYDEGKTSDWS